MIPYFQNLADFIHMNGHGAYVWTCYALVFGAIALMIWYAKSERTKTIAKLSTQTKKLTNKQRQALAKG
ncbi:heme exporter protein CcmD [Moraxella lacunata]|uniref:Heme exporter protein D n=1 Tax=Moraxella lacunata TaxID=477 RepID=A0A1V4GZ53_MORLA|nr:heme exporter protein CcmD [Moraxella lacunata]OPH37949.1 heme exporter protein CcmD [Moraxella lacunata]STZ00309.1 heme exporter protein CcmD [Moraxella lacunata]